MGNCSFRSRNSRPNKRNITDKRDMTPTRLNTILVSVISLLSVSYISIPADMIELIECCICLDGNACIQVIPCNHVCLCENCYVNFIKTERKCPICRKELNHSNPLRYTALWN